MAATASFAQSSVTLSGNLDYASVSQSGTIAGVKGQTVATNIGTSSTSLINIIAVEDLGGGMKATAKYGLDPRTYSNDGTAMARDEVFVGLSGNFGNIRLGSPNSLTLGTFLTASPLGTGVGSGYLPLEFGVLAAGSRYNRSVRYDSPSFNGLTLSVIYAPGNDQSATASAAAYGIPNARPTTEVGAAYNNGPLNISLTQRTADAVSYAASAFETRASNGAVWFPGATSNAAGVIAKSTWTTLAANYKFDNTTVYAGWNDGKNLGSTTAAPADTNGYRVGVRQDIGAIALIASYAQQETGTTKATYSGLRADYNLSKTNAVYLGYESYDSGAASANTRKVTSVGLRKSF